MKNLFLILILIFTSFVSYSQLPYSWSPGTDPGWTSSNYGNGSSLDWDNGCNAVTTNCNGNYSNYQNTSYTSPIIDASCNNASTIIISFDISGNVEWLFDFLFLEYSNVGGTTWTNFYGPNIGLSGNAGNGTNWTLPTIPTSNNLMIRFTFDSDFVFVENGYQITNFQIICNVQLPIELKTFSGNNTHNKNTLTWVTLSETNNSHFILERSTDGKQWENIYQKQGMGNTTNTTEYTFYDRNFENEINYYRLTQVDFDGKSETFEIISIDNRNDKEPIKTLNMLGQEVGKDYNGIVIHIYEDGDKVKEYQGL